MSVAMVEPTAREIQHAEAVARGRCRYCGVRSLDTVRRRADGDGWARWDYTRGCWRDLDGAVLPTSALEPGREEVLQLSVVRAADTAPPFFAGRAILLCELCAQVLTAPPSPPAPRQEELPL